MFAECMRGIFVYRIEDIVIYYLWCTLNCSSSAAINGNLYIEHAVAHVFANFVKLFFKRCTLARFECVCIIAHKF